MEEQIAATGESSGGSHVAVDMNSVMSWAQELRDRCDRASCGLGGGSSSSTSPCPIRIGMVGDLTRNVDPQEYEPYHVSIGPYHRVKHPSMARDDEKLTIFRDFRSARPDVTEERYLEVMGSLESRARSCYVDPITMESKEFVYMLLLDACYVLDLFRNGDAERRRINAPSTIVAANGHAEGEGEYQQTSSSSSQNVVKVVHDVLCLAENQIPFFVIEKVYELALAATRENSGTCAVHSISRYVRELLKMHKYSVAKPELTAPSSSSESEVGNLLHLLHMHLKPTGGGASASATDDGAKPTRDGVSRWHSASEYHYAGVRFKSRPVGVGDNKAQCILDVTLDSGGSGGGTLLVPRLRLDALTLGLLRNLMELEQRNPGFGSHVTAYCFFMWQVACTAGDVELLSKREVIAHILGNNAEVADFFSDLCKGLVFDLDDPSKNYLWGTWQVLEKRFQSRPRRWMALLRQEHLRNPWLASGLVTATVLLLCTVVQAVYAVLSYYRPRGSS